MVSETRHMRSDQHTINGLLAYQLKVDNTAVYVTKTDTKAGNFIAYWGIRIWHRTSGGVESEITAGTPVAQVSRSADGSGMQSNTYTITEHVLDPNDAVVVRVYIKFNDYGWVEVAKFITEVLSADKLSGVTWTVYYHTERYYDDYEGTTIAYYRFGDSTYDSRIENFTYTVVIKKTVTDTIYLSDTRKVNKNLKVSDSIGVADTPLRSWTPIVTDTISLADLATLWRSFSVEDSISLTELVKVIPTRVALDIITLSEQVLVHKSFTLTDGISLSETVTKIIPPPPTRRFVKAMVGTVTKVAERKRLVHGDLPIHLKL